MGGKSALWKKLPNRLVLELCSLLLFLISLGKILAENFEMEAGFGSVEPLGPYWFM